MESRYRPTGQPDPVDSASGGGIGHGYVWPCAPLDIVWSRRFSDREGLLSFVETMPAGPHKKFVEAFLCYRAGRTDEAIAMVQEMLAEDEFDDLWSTRLMQMQGGVLHALGLNPQALEAREKAIVMARRTGNPSTLILALHDQAVSLERTDGLRAQASYVQTIDLIDALDDVPPHVRDELEALRALAVVNLHLFSERTDLALPPGTPDLTDTQERARTVWPHLSAAIHAFRGLTLYNAGQRDEASATLEGLVDPRTVEDSDHSVMVAMGEATRLMILGRHTEAVDLLDSMISRVTPQFHHEILDVKASVYEDMGDFENAYRVVREMSSGMQRLFGDEARVAVRALEIFYRTDEHREAADEARRLSGRIATQAEKWREGSLKDPLTEAWNRRYLEKRKDELAGSTGHQVAVLDLDRFKHVNDDLGHATGDEVLVHVAHVIRDACREGDVCIRLGGDEFSVLRPAGAPGDLAEDLAQACHPGAVPGSDYGEITLSVGVAEVDENGFDAALCRADKAMYAVKRAGGAGVGTA